MERIREDKFSAPIRRTQTVILFSFLVL
jgi:hypothetical protein